MAYATATDLIAELRALRLVEPAQLDEAAQLESHFSDPRALAKELIERRLLTAYQASFLLQDRGAELVLGSYVLLARIGEGGMGQVFKARHQKLGRIVALKVIRKDRLSNPAAVKRFEREMGAACQVSHPNVVHAFDADEVGGTLFFAMELVEGIDLGKLVKSSGPLSVAEACEYVCQAARGLTACHERGLIHRDIKPRNLLLTQPGRNQKGGLANPLPDGRGSENASLGLIKILDLGLARVDAAGGEQHVPRLTQLGKVVGTPDYLAPEQARDSHQVDGRADLYSLGCTLYYLLAGKPPFGGGTAVEKLVSHQIEEAPRLERVRPDVPPDLGAVVRKLLAKHPDDRYQTAAEVIAALEPFTARAVDSVPSPVALPDSPLIQVSQARKKTKAVLQATAVAVASAETPLIVTVARSFIRSPRAGRTPLVVAIVAGSLLLLGLLIVLFFIARSTPDDTPAHAEEALHPTTSNPSTALDKLDSAGIPLERRPLTPLNGLVAVLGESRRRHWGDVQCVAFSADGRFVASGGHDNTVRIWETVGKERAAFRVQGTGVAALAFRPDGKLFALSMTDNKPLVVHSWNPETVEASSTLLAGSISGTSALFSPDVQTLAVTSLTREGVRTIGGVTLWDMALGTARSILEDKTPINLLSWSRDGKTLAVASGKIIKLWNSTTGQERTVLPGPNQAVTHLAVSTAGDTVAWASTQWGRSASGEVKLWDATTGKEQGSFRVSAPVSALAFHPDGGLLAVGTGQAETGRIAIRDLESGKERLSFQGHGGPVMCLSFSADGRTLVSGSSDHTVRLWDLATGAEKDPLHHQHGAATAAAFASDGRSLAALVGSWEPRVRSLDFTTGQERDLATGHRGGISALSFTTEGATLAAWGPWGATFWDATTGQVSGRMGSPGDSQLWGGLAPDGRTVATAGGKDASIKLWDAVSFSAAAKPKATLPSENGPLTALAFSPDGKMLASADADKTIKLWNLPRDGRETLILRRSLRGHNAPIAAVAFCMDGRFLASAGRDGIVKLWETNSGLERHALANSPNLIASLAFSPDGKTLAVWSLHGLNLWDTVSGKEHGTHPKHTALLRAVTFSPDSRRLATADDEGHLILWRNTTSERLDEWHLPGAAHHLAFAADGSHLATANGNGTTYVLRLNPAMQHVKP